MLTKQDLKSLAKLLKFQKEEIIGEVDKKFDLKLTEKLAQQTKEILKGVAVYIQDALIPLFDDYEKRISHLEKHTNHPPVTL